MGVLLAMIVAISAAAERGLEVEGGRVSHAEDGPVRVDTSADIAECWATCTPLPIKMRVRIDSPRPPCGSMEGCRCSAEN